MTIKTYVEYESANEKDEENSDKSDSEKSIIDFTQQIVKEDKDIKIKIHKNEKKNNIITDAEYGHGFLFSKGTNKSGVVWIFRSYSEGGKNEILTEIENKMIISFVNQVALACDGKEQIKKLESKSKVSVNEEINKDNNEVRRQSKLYFILAFFTSVSGVAIIVVAISFMFMGGKNKVDNFRNSAFAAAFGLALQGATILVYRRLSEANLRLDQYHKERFTLGQFEILLSAADEATKPDEIKHSVISEATSKWLHLLPDRHLEMKINDNKE